MGHISAQNVDRESNLLLRNMATSHLQAHLHPRVVRSRVRAAMPSNARHIHMDSAIFKGPRRQDEPLRAASQTAHAKGAATPEELQNPERPMRDIHHMLFASLLLQHKVRVRREQVLRHRRQRRSGVQGEGDLLVLDLFNYTRRAQRHFEPSTLRVAQS